MSRGIGLAAMLLATAAIEGDEHALRALIGPITLRRGTIPNPERQTKAEKKRAKRATRNLRLAEQPEPDVNGA